MNYKKTIFLIVLIALDWLFVHFGLKEDLQSLDFSIIILFTYTIFFNFIIAAIASRTKLKNYAGMFVVNAIVAPIIMYYYTS